MNTSENNQQHHQELQTTAFNSQTSLDDSISFNHYTQIIEIIVRNYFSSCLSTKKFVQFIPEQLPIKKISKLQAFSHQLQRFGINLALKQLSDILSPLQKDFQLLDYLKFKENCVLDEEFDEQDRFLDEVQLRLQKLVGEVQKKRLQRAQK